jgi:hypothetical protein
MSFRVNGWNQQMDYTTGEVRYTCPDCGGSEADGHEEDCPLYFDITEELGDVVEFNEDDDFNLGVDDGLPF